MAEFLGEGLWLEIQRRTESESGKRVAVPYFSSDTILRCGPGDTVVVDATDECVAGGGTAVPVLRRAVERGATVLSHSNLHAKILLFEDCAIVSSANLSLNSTTLREAGARFESDEALAEISKYFDLLVAEAKPIDEKELERLAKLPVVRRDVPRRGPPSVQDALELNLPVLKGLAFGVSAAGRTLRKADVAAAAEERNVRLPGKRWTWFESDCAPGVLSRLRGCAGCVLLDFEVRYRNGTITSFTDLGPDVRPFVEAFRKGDVVVSIFGVPQLAPPVDPTSRADELVGRLSLGVKRADTTIRRRISNEEGLVSLDDIKALYDLGGA